MPTGYVHLTHRTRTRLTYVMWSVMQERVYQTRVHDIDELRQRLITVWCELEQRIVDDAIDLMATSSVSLCRR